MRTILLLLLVTGIKAQVIGFGGGSNFSYFPPSSYGAVEMIPHTSFQGALFVKGTRSPHFNLGGELNYRRRSADLDFYNEYRGNLFLSSFSRYNFDYIGLAFLPEWKSGEHVQWFINLGPSVSHSGSSSEAGLMSTLGIEYLLGPWQIGVSVRGYLNPFQKISEYGVLLNVGRNIKKG